MIQNILKLCVEEQTKNLTTRQQETTRDNKRLQEARKCFRAT